MSDDITTCDGCINGCQECYPFRCYDCGSKTDQDDRDLSRCEFCAEDMRKLKARAKREAEIEGAADFENDLLRDER